MNWFFYDYTHSSGMLRTLTACAVLSQQPAFKVGVVQLLGNTESQDVTRFIPLLLFVVQRKESTLQAKLCVMVRLLQCMYGRTLCVQRLCQNTNCTCSTQRRSSVVSKLPRNPLAWRKMGGATTKTNQPLPLLTDPRNLQSIVTLS